MGMIRYLSGEKNPKKMLLLLLSCLKISFSMEQFEFVIAENNG